MTPQTNEARLLENVPMQSYTTEVGISKDGTAINYRKYGHGPGLVIVHGSMSSAHNHQQLAELLSDAFTVYVPDRRGVRKPHEEGYSILKEVEDLDALIAHTGAQNIFGVSSGGIICLKATQTLSNIEKVAIYEPPLSLTRTEASAILKRFDEEMGQGRVAAALVTGMKGARMGPAIFNVMPRWLLGRLTNMLLKSEEKSSNLEYVPMKELAFSLHNDFQLVVEMSETIQTFKDVQNEVLLLGGSKSPAYLKVALDRLESTIPHVQRIEFQGLNHGASWNSDRGGNPGPVSQELRRFFG